MTTSKAPVTTSEARVTILSSFQGSFHVEVRSDFPPMLAAKGVNPAPEGGCSSV